MNKYVKRLYDEWSLHDKIVIGVDFDDTISPWKLADQKDCDEVIRQLRFAKSTGAYITIFTACDPDRYDYIKDYCKEKGLEVDSINENPIQLVYGNNKKIYANIFIDDRAGLNEALHILAEARKLYFDNYIALKDGQSEF